MISMLEKWCYSLSQKELFFNIYHLAKKDCILINFRQNPQIYLVTKGSVNLSKVFTNQHKLTLGIFRDSDLISVNNPENDQSNYCYIGEALSPTVLLSYDYKRILQQPHQHLLINLELLIAQQQYLNQTYDMIQILSHRNKKSRLINLLLILSERFGIITQFGIIINLIITHCTLGIIIGLSRTTITKTLRLLKTYNLLSIYKRKLVIHDPISLSLHSRTLYINFRKTYR